QFADTPTVDVDFDLKSTATPPTGKLTCTVRNFVDLKRKVEGPGGAAITIDSNQKLADLDLKFTRTSSGANELGSGESITIDRAVLKAVEDKFKQSGQAVPPNEQI